jgi:peptidoglycan/xylan/chitin deacetylase (PgdA/CDA1 family)
MGYYTESAVNEMKNFNDLTHSNQIINLLDRLKIIDTYYFIQSNIRSQVAIITYHHIGTKIDDYLLYRIKTSDFQQQMRYLKQTHEIISFETLHQAFAGKKSLPRRAAIITFDDGYKDNYTEAYPILKKNNIPATIFLTTGPIETNAIFWWNIIGYVLCNTKLTKIDLEDFGVVSPPSKENMFHSLRMTYSRFKNIPEEKKKKLIDLLIQKSDVNIPNDFGKDLMVSWDNVKEMNENGIDFGSHTVTHPILTHVPLNQVKVEIIESKKIIEKKLNRPITTFCYPNGFATDYNADIIQILKDNGFQSSVTAIPKMVTSKSNLFELGRFPSGYDEQSFKLCISGLYSVFSKMLS